MVSSNSRKTWIRAVRPGQATMGGCGVFFASGFSSNPGGEDSTWEFFCDGMFYDDDEADFLRKYKRMRDVIEKGNYATEEQRNCEMGINFGDEKWE